MKKIIIVAIIAVTCAAYAAWKPKYIYLYGNKVCADLTQLPEMSPSRMNTFLGGTCKRDTRLEKLSSDRGWKIMYWHCFIRDERGFTPIMYTYFDDVTECEAYAEYDATRRK